jgi:2-keto-4-pentenoate hydratase/2-oxohepta-3-ene-1,7-dioic acid hydratase in catechol pathway
MKFVRFRADGMERPGCLDAEGSVRDLSGVITDIQGDALSPDGLARLAALRVDELPRVTSTEFGPPITHIGKIIGVGLNYRDHAAECNLPLPKEPTLFLKATSALAGPNDPLVMPRDATSVDWEVELGVVIGRHGVNVAESTALDHVAGYCVGIDFSERHFQFHRGGQGFKGKSADTFGPLGPWFVTADAVADPQDLALTLSVNGTVRQQGTTRDMTFGVRELVAYCSGFMSLHPGDIILTGTPAGVGMGQKPPTYLAEGDEVTATIAGLGTQTHRVVAAR